MKSASVPGVRWQRGLFGGALVVLILFTLFPFYWAIVASLTSDAALFRDPSLWPQHLIFDHYRALFSERDFITPIRNSLVVAGTTTIFCLIVGTLAAYALARIEFRGKAAIMGFILAVTMFPQISIVSPLYLLLRSLHLIDTYPGLIMPYMTFAMPLTVWVLTGSIRQIPKDLEEAAHVDGATRRQSFTRILLPLAVPSLATTGILTFIYCWNEFLFALILTRREAVTLQVGLLNTAGVRGVQWNQMAATGLIVMVPIFILSFAIRRYFVQGLTMGAVK